jgi:hypothetical protein
MSCHHFRQENVHGDIRVTCTLCGCTIRGNSGVMTMHYRVVHSDVARTVVSNYFRQKDADGVSKVECTLCRRVFRRNVQIMNVHFKMVHGPLASAHRHICTLEKVRLENASGPHAANSTKLSNADAHGENNRGFAGTPNQAPQVAECFQRIDALAQRYPAICTDTDLCRSIFAKAPPGARCILTRWLMQRVKTQRDGVLVPPYI